MCELNCAASTESRKFMKKQNKIEKLIEEIEWNIKCISFSTKIESNFVEETNVVG